MEQKKIIKNHFLIFSSINFSFSKNTGLIFLRALLMIPNGKNEKKKKMLLSTNIVEIQNNKGTILLKNGYLDIFLVKILYLWVGSLF